jgi:hypothetical protein
MSEQLIWGKCYVYLYEDFVRVYSYVGGGTSTCAEYTLNSDNSLAERNTKDKLIPSAYWHELRKHEHKIITYLMLKGCT